MTETPKGFTTRSIKMDMEPGKYATCTCGRSDNPPFCDGSHKGTEFKPIITEIKTSKRVSWCGCLISKTMPFCDNAHRELPGYEPKPKN